MRHHTIGTDPKTRREVSVLSLGAMLMGTLTDEATSFAVLDRYAEAGGTFIGTSNNPAPMPRRTQARQHRSVGAGPETGLLRLRSSSRVPVAPVPRRPPVRRRTPGRP